MNRSLVVLGTLSVAWAAAADLSVTASGTADRPVVRVEVPAGEFSGARLSLVWDDVAHADVMGWTKRQELCANVPAEGGTFELDLSGLGIRNGDYVRVLGETATELQLLDTLKTQGVNYIDTCFADTDCGGVEVGFYATGLGTRNDNCPPIICSRQDQGLTVACYGRLDRYYFRYQTTHIGNGDNMKTDACNDIVIRDGVAKANGVVVRDGLAFPVGLSGDHIFLGTNSARSRDSHGVWYYARLYNESGLCVRDYVPAQNAAGVAGFFDQVNETFTASEGPDNYQAGAVTNTASLTVTQMNATLYRLDLSAIPVRLVDSAQADTTMWAGTGVWSDAAHWSFGNLPGEGMSIVVAPDSHLTMDEGDVEWTQGNFTTANVAGGVTSAFEVVSGTLSATRFNLGAEGPFVYEQRGGLVKMTGNYDQYFAQGVASSANVLLSGGEIQSLGALQIAGAGTAEFLQTGGRVLASSWVGVGRLTGGRGVLDVAGGDFLQQGVGALSIAHEEDADGTVIVRGGGRLSAERIGLSANRYRNNSRLFVRDGGRVETSRILTEGSKFGSYGARTIGVDGGTLVATADQAAFLQLVPPIYVGEKGLTFDTGTHAVGFTAQDFVATNTTITKTGEGALRILGGLPDAARVEVAAGTLQLPRAGQPRGLVHRWSFNGDLVDSAGGLAASAVGTIGFTGGRELHLTAGARNTSGVNLGPDVLPVDRPVTLEIWATYQSLATWNMLLDFGYSTANTFAVVWADGDLANKMSLIMADPKTQFAWYGTRTNDALSLAPVGVKTHLSFVFRPNGAGGTTVSVRFANAETGEVLARWQKYSDKWSLAEVTQAECWLGATHFGNKAPEADYDEVRVWGRALQEEELAANVAAGPDTVPALEALTTGENRAELVVDDGATVDFLGGSGVVANLAGDGEVVNGKLTVSGVLSPGGDGTVATLTFGTDVKVTGTIRLDKGDLIDCKGELDLTDATIEMVDKRDRALSGVFATSSGNGIVSRKERVNHTLGAGYFINVSASAAAIAPNWLVLFVPGPTHLTF